MRTFVLALLITSSDGARWRHLKCLRVASAPELRRLVWKRIVRENVCY